MFGGEGYSLDWHMAQMAREGIGRCCAVPQAAESPARLSPPIATNFCGTVLTHCLAPPFPAESASAPQPPRCCAVSTARVQCTTCAFDGLPRCAHDDAWLHPADGRSLSRTTAHLYLPQALSQCF